MNEERPQNSPQSAHMTGAMPSPDGTRDYQLDIRNRAGGVVARYFLYDCPANLLESSEYELTKTVLIPVSAPINSVQFVITRVKTEMPQVPVLEDYVEGRD